MEFLLMDIFIGRYLGVDIKFLEIFVFYGFGYIKIDIFKWCVLFGFMGVCYGEI